MNHRRGMLHRFKRPAFGLLLTRFLALAVPPALRKRLHLSAFGHKNRKKLKLFTSDAGGDASALTLPAATPELPPASNRWRWLQPVLGFLAFAAPLATALIAFTVPLIGVRAYEYVMQSGYFHVRSVLIDHVGAPGEKAHAPYLQREEILRVAGIDALTHVLDLDLELMTARLLAHPWVRWARVDRQLPDTLVVHLSEHRPTAYLAAGTLYLVDEFGAPFSPAPADYTAHLPVISGIAPERLGDVNDAPGVERELARALNILRTWAAQGLTRRYPIGELRLGGAGVSAMLEGKSTGTATEIVLGHAPFREKLFRLEWVLEHLRSLGKTADYILLDLGDDLPAGAVEIGGARVVVKTDLASEAIESPAAPNIKRPPTPTREIPSQDTPESTEPSEPIKENAEAAPVSGGRPAADDGQE